MGGLISRVRSYFLTTASMRIVMFGMDGAGKTTILYKLKQLPHQEIINITTIPTIQFNVETIEYANVSLTMWDIGGGDRARPLWRHYYENTQAIIFVIDSSESEGIDREGDNYNAKSDLNRVLADDMLREVPLLIFANKQDLPNVISIEEVTERLGLRSLRNREWHVQGVSATQNSDALYEGLEWLIQIHKKGGKTKSALQVLASDPSAAQAGTGELPRPAADGINLSSV